MMKVGLGEVSLSRVEMVFLKEFREFFFYILYRLYRLTCVHAVSKIYLECVRTLM